ncbi:TetR-like C-terminal domain-containing protein [Actinomadura yumaensis]|uniref:TetR-like C-terminal domain-containing protein n=1 Tax=Actinomadura yumaensis TaxID=111807 RepID=UPI00360DECC0
MGKQTIYRWWPSKGAVMFDSLLAHQREEGGALPDTGDVEADLKLVLRATVAQFNDPVLDGMTRALAVEIQNDPSLGREMVDRLLGPQLEATKDRIRSAQRAGQIAEDLDLSVVVEMIFAPLFHRWMLRTAPLTPEYADSVVEMALGAFARRRAAPGDRASSRARGSFWTRTAGTGVTAVS